MVSESLLPEGDQADGMRVRRHCGGKNARKSKQTLANISPGTMGVITDRFRGNR
jgi:hypothetical protein